jgi:hypothetical protein
MNRCILTLIAIITIGSTQCFSQINSLKGAVFNSENGRPIKNALVVIEKENVKIDSLYSDRKGQYSFENVKLDTFNLVVKKKKFVSTILENITLNDIYKNIEVSLNKRITIKIECYFIKDIE